MGHYAKVVDGIVTQVIVAEAEFFDTFVDTEPGKWVQTSYNTRGGVHYEPNSNTPSNDQSKALRKNYGGIGWIYDSEKDAFYEQQPYPSWTLNDSTCMWESPSAKPDDGKEYYWDENSKSWKENV
tara:strand:- start:203 stop:577 length:375 start_codon:yes stop_codon:yes gene_type:complete